MASRIDYAAVAAMAAEGKCVAEVAAAQGCNAQSIYKWSRDNGVKFVRKRHKGHERRDARSEQVTAMFRQGVTMENIGAKFGITRERVRQVLKKVGMTGIDGGQRVVTQAKVERKRRAFEARILAKWGVDVELWRELRANGTIRGFEYHRRNAFARGIAFRFTFADWYAVWMASGKLHLRGRGKGKYCMSRLNDAGAYELGNVHIQLCTENSTDATLKWKGKTKPVRGVFLLYPGRDKAWLAKVGKVRLGYFASMEEAAAARDAYLQQNPPRPRARGGVTRVPRLTKNPYRVTVRSKHIGQFPTREAAEAARDEAVARLFSDFATEAAPSTTEQGA